MMHIVQEEAYVPLNDSVMGIRQARHIDLSEYSWLSSAFCQ